MRRKGTLLSVKGKKGRRTRKSKGKNRLPMIRRDFLPGHRDEPPKAPADEVGAIPISEEKLRKAFDSLSPDPKTDLVPLHKFMKYYATLDNFGVIYSPEEEKQRVTKYLLSSDGQIGFDEFSCIVLSLAQR
jgi:hypothetical protein